MWFSESNPRNTWQTRKQSTRPGSQLPENGMAATLLQRATVQNRGKISSGQIVLLGQWYTVARAGSSRFGGFTSTSSGAVSCRCHANGDEWQNVILMVANGGKMRTKGE